MQQALVLNQQAFNQPLQTCRWKRLWGTADNAKGDLAVEQTRPTTKKHEKQLPPRAQSKMHRTWQACLSHLALQLDLAPVCVGRAWQILLPRKGGASMAAS